VSAHPDLPDGYSPRPATPEDAQAVTELVAACEKHDTGEVLIELEDIVAEWQRPSLDLAQNSVLVFADGGLAAAGEVAKGRRAEVYVRPQHRGRGIGSALMRWTWDVARAAGGSVVGQSIPDSLTGAAELFGRNEYEPLWTSWILELPADAPLGDAELPAGVEVRSFVPGRDERAAYRVIEDAFREWPNREPTTFEDWTASVLGRPGFRPEQLQMLLDGSEVVGACNAAINNGNCWVDQVAVRRDHRGRGLGRALLMRAFQQAREQGAVRCELSTDSRTGALGLYQHVGMRVTSTYVHWAKQL
jgi:mycothiol synthase